jgi:hypothetical protein
MMPRDVTTRWNSTYDMLIFALEYRTAIDEISGDREMQKYELEEKEWELVQQLCDILEVRHSPSFLVPFLAFAVIQGRHPFLFAFNAQSCHCDTCNGSHRCTSRHGNPKHEVFTSHSRFTGTWKSSSQQILRHE